MSFMNTGCLGLFPSPFPGAFYSVQYTVCVCWIIKTKQKKKPHVLIDVFCHASDMLLEL